MKLFGALCILLGFYVLLVVVSECLKVRYPPDTNDGGS